MVRNLSATNVSWDLSGTYVLSKETNLFAPLPATAHRRSRAACSAPAASRAPPIPRK
ncbi:hypothetical protein LP419_10835 [Massilia sp. H-1]|nr:hypothetical protein LP419_10835 [Massilia sp. H-1]